VNFSEFAKLLYLYIDIKQDYPDYVLFQITLIMPDHFREKETLDERLINSIHWLP
jgi:hypothetical protein